MLFLTKEMQRLYVITSLYLVYFEFIINETTSHRDFKAKLCKCTGIYKAYYTYFENTYRNNTLKISNINFLCSLAKQSFIASSKSCTILRQSNKLFQVNLFRVLILQWGKLCHKEALRERGWQETLVAFRLTRLLSQATVLVHVSYDELSFSRIRANCFSQGSDDIKCR